MYMSHDKVNRYKLFLRLPLKTPKNPFFFIYFFWTNWSSEFFRKVFCLYLSNQISLRGRFVFKTNGMISSITSYKDHCCSFFTSWVIKQQKSCILNILEKTPNFGCTVRTLDNTLSLKIKFSEAYTQRSMGICKKN